MQRVTPLSVLTVGHSTHTYEHFLKLLQGAGVTAVADVRTAPYSRYLSQFNREQLQGNLRCEGIAYSYLGKELGGRPDNPSFFQDKVADYERMATSDHFRHGLRRVVEGAGKYRLALMCAEHDPVDCHRCLLVGRALAKDGVLVGHILQDGTVSEQAQVESRLLDMTGRDDEDLFAARSERLAYAYRERARKVAFAEAKSISMGSVAAE